PQPGRRREAGVEQWRDGNAGQGESDLDRRLGGHSRGGNRRQEDDDDGYVTEAEGAHTGFLNRRSVAGTQPEADTRFAHATAPDQDECRRREQLEPPGGSAAVGEPDDDLQSRGSGDRQGDD